jgi:intraflagellar transport protein 56
MIDSSPSCDLRIRLQFHLARAMDNDDDLMAAQAQLLCTPANQLCLAAMHYARAAYSQAIEIYQKMLIQRPEYIALQAYIAMCEFKSDQFTEANDSIDSYLADQSDSAIALNLKACAYWRLFDPALAESQILQIKKFSSASYQFVDDLIVHNLCVFNDGTDGLAVLPRLVGAISEARYNLVVLHLRRNNVRDAQMLMEHFKTVDIYDQFLKAAIGIAIGQLDQDSPSIAEANAAFETIGKTEAICDTVPGRQALAMSHFIQGNYGKALQIFQTIESFMTTCDEFHYNRGMAFASSSEWVEAERNLLKVQNQWYKRDLPYKSWLCRCYIKNKKFELAWELYSEQKEVDHATQLLQIIASDAFEMGGFYFAMQAFQLLSQNDPEPYFKEGMIAAAIGLFRKILSKTEPQDRLQDVIAALSAEPTAQRQLELIVRHIERM